MPNPTILDNLSEITDPPAKSKVQKIFLWTELSLWALCGLEFLLWKYYTHSFLVELSVFPYRLLPGFSILALFYIIFPVWIFGSAGWGRHILSHISGLYIAAGVFFSFLHIDHVFYNSQLADEGTVDMCTGVIDLYLIFLIVFAVVFLIRKNSPRGRAFYWAVLFRLGIALALLALSIWVVHNKST